MRERFFLNYLLLLQLKTNFKRGSVYHFVILRNIFGSKKPLRLLFYKTLKEKSTALTVLRKLNGPGQLLSARRNSSNLLVDFLSCIQQLCRVVLYRVAVFHFRNFWKFRVVCGTVKLQIFLNKFFRRASGRSVRCNKIYKLN